MPRLALQHTDDGTVIGEGQLELAESLLAGLWAVIPGGIANIAHGVDPTGGLLERIKKLAMEVKNGENT